MWDASKDIPVCLFLALRRRFFLECFSRTRVQGNQGKVRYSSHLQIMLAQVNLCRRIQLLVIDSRLEEARLKNSLDKEKVHNANLRGKDEAR